MPEIIGYACALMVGIVLGILGGGGAILGVPILVYLMKIDELQATGYSLFIVGTSSLVGAMNYLRKNPEQKSIILSTVLWFAPSTILVGITVRKLIKWGVPETIFSIGEITFTRNLMIMLFFAVIMIIVAQKMLSSPKSNVSEKEISPFRKSDLLKRGIVVGIVAGIAGSGAGFLITPVLVKYMKMSMKMAVGTSLWIISANSWFIFLGDLIGGKGLGEINWNLLLLFTGIAVVGIFIGNRLSGFFSNEKLKRAFGYFVLVIGALILVMEYWKL